MRGRLATIGIEARREMSTEPKNGHVREGLCCFGMLYSCGHSAECMYDKEWKEWHYRKHKWDGVPQLLFWVSLWIAIFVLALTSKL